MPLWSPMPDLVIPDVNFSDYMFSKLATRGNKVTMIDSSNNDNQYTFQEVRENAMKCGSAFYRMGLRKGDVVATCLTNCAEYTFIVMGVNACGGILTTSNPNNTKNELSFQFKQTEPKFVFCNLANYLKVQEVCTQLDSVKEIFNMEDEPNKKTFSQFLAHGNSKDFPFDVSVDPEDVALILYSSGTTGIPKGVMLTHRNLVASLTIGDASMRWSRIDAIYLVLPMFHVYGTIMSLLVMSKGSKVVLKKRYDLMQMMGDIQKYKITRLIAVPPIIVGMDQLLSNHGFDISSLRELDTGAAPLPESVALSVSKKLNVSIKNGWGMTEGVPAAHHLDDCTPVLSIGNPSPNTLLKIIDTNSGRELGPNKDGEICIKGPQVMKGYYKNPEATAKTIDSEGWLHTGDIGHYDDNEFIYIVDRLKELIKYKGFQVAPAELEDVLLRHPKIVDVVVIGVPDPKAGELPKAFVVRKDPDLTGKEIHEFLKDKVSKFKYLSGGITFVDAIPKSASGKILRRVLRRRVEETKISSKY